jgi:hypothetical protein
MPLLTNYNQHMNLLGVRLVSFTTSTWTSLFEMTCLLQSIILLLLGTPSPEDSTPEDLNFVPADGNSQ